MPSNVYGSLYLCWGVLGDEMEQYSIYMGRAGRHEGNEYENY